MAVRLKGVRPDRCLRPRQGALRLGHRRAIGCVLDLVEQLAGTHQGAPGKQATADDTIDLRQALRRFPRRDATGTLGSEGSVFQPKFPLPLKYKETSTGKK